MHGTRVASLLVAVLVSGCAVVPFPTATALRSQTPHDQKWDARECRWEAEARSLYNAGNSPGANLLARVFFWGTSGAAVGGLFTGIPASTAGPATDGLIAGAGAGGIVGGVTSWSGQERFERLWVACMESRGYSVATGKAAAAEGSAGGENEARLGFPY